MIVIVCNAKPKILTIWAFSEKVCQSLANTNSKISVPYSKVISLQLIEIKIKKKEKISVLAITHVVSNGVLEPAHFMRADCVRLFSPMYFMMSCWQQEISQEWRIYTNTHHKSDILFPQRVGC